MSWNYELVGKCEKFHLLRATARAGDEHAAAIQGEPVDERHVRVPTVSCTIEGRFTINVAGEQWTVEAPNWDYPGHPEEQVMPGGMAVSTCEENLLGLCAVPVPGKALARRWRLGPCEEHFEETVHVVVAYGDVTINGVPLPPFTIGRGTDFTVEGDGLVAFIWER